MHSWLDISDLRAATMSDDRPQTDREEFGEAVDALVESVRPYFDRFAPYMPYYMIGTSILAFVEALLTSDPLLGFLAGGIFGIALWARDLQRRPYTECQCVEGGNDE